MDDLPRNIDCESDLLFLKYISGIIDIKEFSAEYLKDINLYIEKSVDNYLNLSKEIGQDNILASYPAEIFTEDEIVKYIGNQLHLIAKDTIIYLVYLTIGEKMNMFAPY